MQHSPVTAGCRGVRSIQRISRRESLRLGGLWGLGLTLTQWVALRAQAQSGVASGSFGRAKRVIMLYLHGGHPQQETFDPKPEGPEAVRGEFGAIPTSLPGVRFSELLPLTSRIAHKLTVIRSMSHDNPNHVTASLPANTGHSHPPGTPRRDFPPSGKDFPPFGAVRGKVAPASGNLPAWVRVGPLMRRNNGTVLHGQLPGFLGAQYASFNVDQDLLPDDVTIEAVQSAEELTPLRLDARRDLLRQFDGQRQLLERSAEARTLDTYYQRAFGLLSSSETRQAFNLAEEPARLRERYGRTEFGQRCLLARRLTEAGVPMVNVSYCHTPRGSWDTHSRNFTQMKESLAPTLDTAFRALMDDLEERGLLEETLVVINAEFGRTPKINKNAGRDHWPWVYSLVLAGAGVRPGTVYGASDASAAYPTETPHSQADFAATLYHLMGIDAETILHDIEARPHPLVTGTPITGLLG